jgi:rare lipoprotein A
MPTNQKIEGTASWYGPYFHGRLTATGEVFNQNDLTAAHPSLPFNTYLQVTNLLTNKTVIVRINDRGPYFEDRSLDLSREAARSLGSEAKGVVPYEAIIMERVDLAQRDSTQIEQTNSEAVQDLSPNRSQLSIQTLANRP